ncbi:hypothetical protein LEMLEM_LOCUS22806 [Lemmus lemmus]
MRTSSRTSCPFVCHSAQIAGGPVVSGGAKIHRDSGRLTQRDSTYAAGRKSSSLRRRGYRGAAAWEHPDPLQEQIGSSLLTRLGDTGYAGVAEQVIQPSLVPVHRVKPLLNILLV